MFTFNAAGIVDWLGKLGVGGLALLALVGFYQGWWVFGREVAALQARVSELATDRDKWQARYFATLQVGERAVTTASQVVANGETMVVP